MPAEKGIDLSNLTDAVIKFENGNGFLVSKIIQVGNSYLRDNGGNRTLAYHLSSQKIDIGINNVSLVEELNRCAILSPETRGWQPGRVRVQIRLEFYPDNPNFLLENQNIPKSQDTDSNFLDELRNLKDA